MQNIKRYSLLALVFVLCWPVAEHLLDSQTLIPEALADLVFAVPIMFAFVLGLRSGYRVWPAVAVVTVVASGLGSALNIDTLAHDSTVVATLPHILVLIAVLSGATVAFCVAGGFIHSKGIRVGILGLLAAGLLVELGSIFVGWYGGGDIAKPMLLETSEIVGGFTAVLAVLSAVVVRWGVQDGNSDGGIEVAD